MTCDSTLDTELQGFAVMGKGFRLASMNVAAELIEQNDQRQSTPRRFFPLGQLALGRCGNQFAESVPNLDVPLRVLAKPEFHPRIDRRCVVLAFAEPQRQNFINQFFIVFMAHRGILTEMRIQKEIPVRWLLWVVPFLGFIVGCGSDESPEAEIRARISAMAEAAGLRVHVFTSPHLVRFNERIRLGGTLISDDLLEQDLGRVYAALDGRPITHFEATTATALLTFSEAEADLLVLEVGLGGRFDATNVIDVPAISVITPVD